MGRFSRISSLLFGMIIMISWSSKASPSEGSLDKIKKRGYLLWGSDAQGGAPYIFPDPKDPSKLIGFEKDIADAIARELGVSARQSQNAWDSLIPGLKRGDYDIAMNGIEITPQRREEVLFSRPYYVYTEQLVVRKDGTGIRDLVDEGMTTLIATHEMDFARDIADRVVVFDNGDIIETGPPDEIFTNPKTERTKIFLGRVLKKG